jgi:hypothetical protein
MQTPPAQSSFPNLKARRASPLTFRLINHQLNFVQVADFDFNNSEEDELQYKTFWERLRESFGKSENLCRLFCVR